MSFGFSQNTQSFYHHYTGLISEEIKITADLIKLESSFSGFYYYEFKEDGAWKTSKPIALDGMVNEQDEFILNEFGSTDSFFRGKLENEQLIVGEWINPLLKEPVSFTIKATYAQGSIHLKLIESKADCYFNNDPNAPKGSIQTSILFPDYKLDAGVYHQLMRRIYKNIGYRSNNDSKEDVISSIEDGFRKQFQAALENIQLDSFPDQFNWEKTIRMDVINNEGDYLCLQFETYAKTGMQDGSVSRKYVVFDLENNQILNIADIMNTELSDQIHQLLNKKLRKQYRIKEELSLIEAGFFQDQIELSNNFYIHPGGLGIYYNVYEIAPFGNGPTNLFFTWEELTPLLIRNPF